MSRFSLRSTGIAIWLLATGLLVLHAWTYMPFIADDSLISLRYADRLLHGLGLTWTDGPRVEGYSNLLWVLACALMGKLGFDLIDGARILGLLGMSAAIAAVVYAYRPKSKNLSNILPPLAAGLVLALSGTIAVWTIGGLEQPFVAAFLAWMLVLLYSVAEGNEVKFHTIWLSGLFGGLLCLTRPDSPLFIAAACIAILLIRGLNKGTIRILVAFGTIPVLCVAGQLAFRLIYYREWVPNTAYVKIAFSLNYLIHGGYYLSTGFLFGLPLTVIVVIVLRLGYQKKISKNVLIYLVLPLIAWVGYVLIIGGDVFPARRHFTPIVIIIAFLVAEVVTYFMTIRSIKFITMRIMLASIAFIVLEYIDIADRRGNGERWEWEGKTISTTLKNAFYKQQPLLAVDAAGCIPYWSGFPCIDMLGLNDYYIAHHPPADFGDGHIGHGLGDGMYVMRRKPDMIFLCGPLGGEKWVWLSGQQMQSTPDFYRIFSLVKLRLDDTSSLYALVWVNKESPKIGIQYNQDTITIPAWLANADTGTTAEPGIDGNLVALVNQNTPERIKDIPLRAGTWRIAIEPVDSAIHFKINTSANDSAFYNVTANPIVMLSDSTAINIELMSDDSRMHRIKTITCIRMHDEVNSAKDDKRNVN